MNIHIIECQLASYYHTKNPTEIHGAQEIQPEYIPRWWNDIFNLKKYSKKKEITVQAMISKTFTAMDKNLMKHRSSLLINCINLNWEISLKGPPIPHPTSKTYNHGRKLEWCPEYFIKRLIQAPFTNVVRFTRDKMNQTFCPGFSPSCSARKCSCLLMLSLRDSPFILRENGICLEILFPRVAKQKWMTAAENYKQDNKIYTSTLLQNEMILPNHIHRS